VTGRERASAREEEAEGAEEEPREERAQGADRGRLSSLVRGGARCSAFAVQMGSLEGCEGQPRPFQEGSHNSLDSLAHRWRRGGFVAQV
jgi:hypothetical protein